MIRLATYEYSAPSVSLNVMHARPRNNPQPHFQKHNVMTAMPMHGKTLKAIIIWVLSIIPFENVLSRSTIHVYKCH